MICFVIIINIVKYEIYSVNFFFLHSIFVAPYIIFNTNIYVIYK